MYRVAPSRRHFILGATALVASAAFGPAFGAKLSDFVDATWQTAKSRGVSRKTFETAMGGFKPLNSVLKLTGKQPEFVSTAADYVGKRVDGAKAAQGQGMRAEWTQTLAAVSERYGVQPEIVLAIWGIETNFGGYMGSTNTVHGLATLAHAGYRADFFGQELITALEILEAGHVKSKNMVGSWAGAMGHPQFMPSSFMKYAVDFKGDGHKDIWGSIPDALASTANYLKSFGWRSGETWGYEVALPANFNYNNVWNDASAKLSDWSAIGVKRANGKAFPRGDDVANLYMPMGGNGPVFAVLPNFGVIKRYNNSSSYALAVGHLADRILGSTGFVNAWPSDTGLTKAQRVELQARLGKRGYDLGTPDGVIGPKTRAALMDFQSRAGLTADGFPSGNALKALG
ncbi:MAG: lytic murein transglycosylase [Devosia sp.]|uniref:lytic murein transglycosylase n=1 Tax=Devosia sp. TaxID=1871048 RepID=UPI001A58F0DE|nr:lytic murein transglycosylase [Devosia sp.]MBL8599607.1 lytic murein transglycosylase [Devosia sp.]